MKTNEKNHKIFRDELKRTFPSYFLGMVFHAICIYILYKIPSILGEILDLLLEGNIQKEVIMGYVYKLILYSILMIIPRIIDICNIDNKFILHIIYKIPFRMIRN